MPPYTMTWRPFQGYWPTQPVTGESNDTIYRGQNMILKGGADKVYLEQWSGYLTYGTVTFNSTDNTLTGTVAVTTGSQTVTGTSTKFLSELIPGQPITIDGVLYVPLKLISNTSMLITPASETTGSGITVGVLRQIQEVDQFLATFTRGSIIKLPQGNLMGVGRGTVFLDAAAVPSGGWTLRDQASLAVFDNGTGNYSIYRLGMKTPAAPTLARTTGGAKSMQPGDYSIRLVPARIATGGWNNPSEAASVTLTTVGDRITITFPAMDTGAGQDSWRVYGSLFSRSDAVSGPWYFVTVVTSTDLGGTGAGTTLNVEWRDAEIEANDVLEFDNNAPPPAVFIGSLAGLPVLIGTNGPGRTLTGTVATNGTATVTGTSTLFTTELAIDRFVWINNLFYRVLTITSDTSMTVTPVAAATASGLTIRSADEAPGPVLRPAKPSISGFNIEAFPARSAVAINPPEAIIGYIEATGRLYLLTANRLHIAVPSGDPVVPIITRPFWRTGFRNPRACIFVNGYLYGFTTNGATRSAGMGDDVSEEHDFAAAVTSDMAGWDPGKVSLAYNPKEEAVAFIHADDGTRPQTATNIRYSTVLMYMLRLGKWSPPCRLEDTDDVSHIYATATATVQGDLYFASPIANGDTRIYQLQGPTSGDVGETFVTTPFMDMGGEGLNKTVEGLVLTAGRTDTDPVIADIYGSQVGGVTPVTDLFNGTNSLSGPLPFSVDTPIVTTGRQRLNVRQVRTVAVRVELTSVGSEQCRIDELIIDGEVDSVRY